MSKWSIKPVDHVIEARHPIARIRDGEMAITRRTNIGDVWQSEKQVVDALFGADIHQLQHGWEYYTEADGKKRRMTKLAPFSAALPDKPQDNAKQVYVLPVYGKEIGGRVDLIADERLSSEGLSALFAQFDGAPEVDAGQVPIIGMVGVEETEFGMRPVFAVGEWVARPARWGAKLNG